jgi:hypothetical protein
MTSVLAASDRSDRSRGSGTLIITPHPVQAMALAPESHLGVYNVVVLIGVGSTGLGALELEI